MCEEELKELVKLGNKVKKIRHERVKRRNKLNVLYKKFRADFQELIKDAQANENKERMVEDLFGLGDIEQDEEDENILLVQDQEKTFLTLEVKFD